MHHHTLISLQLTVLQAYNETGRHVVHITKVDKCILKDKNCISKMTLLYQHPFSSFSNSILWNVSGHRQGTWWCSWLRHWATSWNVAGLIADCVSGLFHWHNLSGYTMALRLTQPLTEMSNSGISWGLGGKGGQCVRLTTLPPSWADGLEIVGASTSWNPRGLSRPLQG
jgi:hypothetical protein